MMKDLNINKRIMFIYVSRNNQNFTYSIAYMYKIIDYSYNIINNKEN